MNFGDNFRLWSPSLPIQALRDRVLAMTEEEWEVNEKGRAEKFAAHAASQHIPLKFDPDFRHATNRETEHWDRWRDVVEPVVASILEQFPAGSKLHRALLVRLRPGGEVKPHPDLGWSLPYGHRLHLALVTNPEVTFTVGGEVKWMKEGELWEINNTRVHTVHNPSPHHRTHLIVDIATPQLEARRDADILRFKEDLTIIINVTIGEMMADKLTNPDLVARIKQMREALRAWQIDDVFASNYRDGR